MLSRNYDNYRHRPPAIQFTDEHGRQCLKVPLDPHGNEYALVDEAAYRRVRGTGAVSPWLLNGNGRGTRYVRTLVPAAGGGSTLVTVARLIAGSGPKETVRFANGDRLDLRYENLRTFKGGKAKRSDCGLAQRGAESRAARAAA